MWSAVILTTALVMAMAVGAGVGQAVAPTPTVTVTAVRTTHAYPVLITVTADNFVFRTKTVTKTRTATKTRTIIKTVSARMAPSRAIRTRETVRPTGINTHGMSITWGCHPTRGCHYGVTDLSTCHVWIQAPAWVLQSTLNHEFIHVRQCQRAWWPDRTITQIERVADAGAWMLAGTVWSNYCRPCSSWEQQQARSLLS